MPIPTDKIPLKKMNKTIKYKKKNPTDKTKAKAKVKQMDQTQRAASKGKSQGGPSSQRRTKGY